MPLTFISGQHLPAPGFCLSCGSVGVDCVDSGSNKDFYGALLLCKVCFRDGALNIPELELFDKIKHENMVADLEEKIEWRNSLEPTIARLEADINRAVYNARHGFNQRYITDSINNEILGSFGSHNQATSEESGLAREVDEQLFFTLEELRDYVGDTGQVDNNAGNQGPVGISSGPSNADQ